MQTWIVILGLFSIAATAGLTWILMRVNQGGVNDPKAKGADQDRHESVT